MCHSCRMRKVGAALAGLALAIGGVSACTADEPTAAEFCEAVALVPDGSSVKEAQKAFAEVEDSSPSQIREDVAVLRAAIETASTEADLDTMDERGGPLEAATVSFGTYVDEHCP
jgi:hypothetical protein